MSKTFLIPDIHENIEWANRVLAQKQTEDGGVFLGDYFDQFDQDRTSDVCVWLKEMLGREDVVLLLGNHDLAYIGYQFGINDYLCSGWTRSKQAVFNAYFPDAWELVRRCALYHYPATGVLVTHAGLTRPAIDPELGMRWDLFCAEGEVQTKRPYHLLLAGKDRGGREEHGGITWCDWRSFEPISGIRQIVGHTPGDEVREKDGNFCVDCNQTWYAVVDEVGSVEFKKL